jgi:hypothetical protein
MDNNNQDERNNGGFNYQDGRFEFVLYINKNPILKRNFNIYKFNEDSRYSLELKELMDNLAGLNNGQWGTMGIIPEFFKKKSIESLWRNYDPNYVQNHVGTGKNINLKDDNFDVEIRINDTSIDGEKTNNVMAESRFSANWFTAASKQEINVREIYPNILSEIKYYLSLKEYTFEYNGVTL